MADNNQNDGDEPMLFLEHTVNNDLWIQPTKLIPKFDRDDHWVENFWAEKHLLEIRTV